MKVVFSEVIARTLDDVWAVIDDPERQPEWQKELVSYEQVAGDPRRAGGVAQMIYLVDGAERDVTATLLEREQLTRVLWDLKGLPLGFTVEHVLRDRGDGATEWTGTIDARIGLLQKPLTPIVKPMFERAVKRLGESLKAFVESQ